MDSSCSFHMTPNYLWLQVFTTFKGCSIFLGDNKFCKIITVGTTNFCLHDGTKRVLEEVRFIPSLKQNIISLSELDNKGICLKVSGKW